MTNWKSLISDLRSKAGPAMTYADIARAVEVQNVSTISELARDKGTKEPRYSTGQKLISLHKRLCLNKRAA